ncbi:MAG TPA: KTSC domain-containing protein [Steroidobacteraceae bacterium]|nr:KTSC domain-containing protein [Steroidobacteraceae bacterium]
MPSAVIRSFEYDETSRTLLITFQSGRRYRYLDVPPEIFEAMRTALAKGVFFNAHIRERFAYREERAEH